ncbi:hypothetical protein ABT369_39305 [Dactylosporangium sp. NPDC000244]|uniref:hypothetical protein n=1 Tax=Dactylosporangium sp. NPDC000244 TaxID=3154365 RepID=UPI00331B4034
MRLDAAMTDLFVVVHTDESGIPYTLGTVVYTDRAVAERRVQERRRRAEAQRWPDRFDVYRLVPVEEPPSGPDDRAELDELGPAEWAFDTLQRIAAFGFHSDHRHELRAITKEARTRFQAGNQTPDETRS